jgi:hypothetical protein
MLTPWPLQQTRDLAGAVDSTVPQVVARGGSHRCARSSSALEELHVANAASAAGRGRMIGAALGVSKQAVHRKHGRRRRLLG